MTVVDGRAAIVAEVDRTSAGLRGFVITSLQQLLADPAFHGAVPGTSHPKKKAGLFCCVGNSMGLPICNSDPEKPAAYAVARPIGQ